MHKPAAPEEVMDRSGSVIIGLGNGVDLELTKEGYLQLTQWRGPDLVGYIPLGKGTSARFDELRDYIKRLSVHSVS